MPRQDVIAALELKVTRNFRRYATPLVRLEGRGEYWTLDRRYRVYLDDSFMTMCETSHPMRSEKGHGEYCPGGESHYYSKWVVYDELMDDYVGGNGPEPCDTLKEAAELLAAYLAKEAARPTSANITTIPHGRPVDVEHGGRLYTVTCQGEYDRPRWDVRTWDAARDGYEPDILASVQADETGELRMYAKPYEINSNGKIRAPFSERCYDHPAAVIVRHAIEMTTPKV